MVMITHADLTQCVACALAHLQKCIILLADLNWDVCGAGIPKGHLHEAPLSPRPIEILYSLRQYTQQLLIRSMIHFCFQTAPTSGML